MGNLERAIDEFAGVVARENHLGRRFSSAARRGALRLHSRDQRSRSTRRQIAFAFPYFPIASPFFAPLTPNVC
jgi:hypothetical protein